MRGRSVQLIISAQRIQLSQLSETALSSSHMIFCATWVATGGCSMTDVLEWCHVHSLTILVSPCLLCILTQYICYLKTHLLTCARQTFKISSSPCSATVWVFLLWPYFSFILATSSDLTPLPRSLYFLNLSRSRITQECYTVNMMPVINKCSTNDRLQRLKSSSHWLFSFTNDALQKTRRHTHPKHKHWENVGSMFRKPISIPMKCGHQQH